MKIKLSELKKIIKETLNEGAGDYPPPLKSGDRIIAQVTDSHLTAEEARDAGLDRWTAYVKFQHSDNPEDYDIEEIDVDAVGKKAARKMALIELEAGYAKPGKSGYPQAKIAKMTKQFGLYM
jgi:hypothetical protein